MSQAEASERVERLVATCSRMILIALLLGGCMTKAEAVSLRTGGDVTPVIEIKPGFAERLALMDAYRFDDGMRKHMMRRPTVTVEQLPDDESVVETAPAGDDQ